MKQRLEQRITDISQGIIQQSEKEKSLSAEVAELMRQLWQKDQTIKQLQREGIRQDRTTAVLVNQNANLLDQIANLREQLLFPEDVAARQTEVERHTMMGQMTGVPARTPDPLSTEPGNSYDPPPQE